MTSAGGHRRRVGHRSFWPESYGFRIVGNGPCYVISVERGGVAHRAGVCLGDQIVELDGHNVVDMSSDAIRTLAKNSGSEPPALGVVSRVRFPKLLADRQRGYGMTLKGVRPTVVTSVDPVGPAYLVGIRIGMNISQFQSQN